MLENNNYIDLRDYSTVIVLLILFIFLVFLSLIIIYNRQLKRKITKLNLVNIEFQEIIARNELRLKEIHHRIKNNLQLILSLLNIEASNKKAISVDDFLLKGQSRIQSIVEVHQNLYEADLYNNICLQNYIEGLVQSLSRIYSQEVDFEIAAHNTILDIETTIPLGLIITELVSNSFKHAFVGTDEPCIKIDIKKNEDKKYLMTLQDNGIGFPEKPSSNVAIGLELVSMLVLQINGQLNRENQQGAIYNISF